MTHADVIQVISEALKGQTGISALFLSGSYGCGLEDAYSDIDFLLVSEEGASDRVADLWRAAVEQTGEIVLWWDRKPVPVLINAITADWTRTDVVILKPDQLANHAQATLKPVFDPQKLYESLRPAAPSGAVDGARLLHQIQDFIRILGLLDLAVGREEYLNGVLGTLFLRNALVDLMIAETNAPNRGGILHLNRLITPEQKAILMAMPAAIPEREAMINAQLAYAAVYLPRARVWAAKHNVAWPERFEEVTWEKLSSSLGVTRPY